MIWLINTQIIARPLRDPSNNMLFLVMRQLHCIMHKLNVLTTGSKLRHLSILQWILVSVTTSLTLRLMANYHHFHVEFDIIRIVIDVDRPNMCNKPCWFSGRPCEPSQKWCFFLLFSCRSAITFYCSIYHFIDVVFAG